MTYLSEWTHYKSIKLYWTYEKSFLYKDENKISRTMQGLSKKKIVRQISTMQFKKCISKGYKIYDIQVKNLLEKENKV